jgi:hypothetical protein
MIDFYTLENWRSIYKEWEFTKNKSILFMIGFNFVKVGIGIKMEYGRHHLWKKKNSWKVLAFTIRFLIIKMQIGYSFLREIKNESNYN